MHLLRGVSSPIMTRRLSATAGYFMDILRDLAGTLRLRWRRFHRRLASADGIAAVGVDVTPFLEPLTGVGWYEWNLLEALGRRDDGLFYNLYAHSFPAPSEPTPPRIPSSPRLRLRIHALPRGFLLPARMTQLLLRTFVEPLLRILDGNDVLFAPNFYIHPTQAAYGRGLVATVHDLGYALMADTVAPETVELMRRHLPTTLFHADRIIAVSAATASDLEEHLGVPQRRVHVVHEGRDPLFGGGPEPMAKPTDLPDRYLLFVSTIEPRKNVTGVLRAFRLLVEWGYDGHLLLVGRWGWRTEAIQSELETSPVQDRIIHLDYVERDRLVEFYRHADALLYPSWLEGFGLPILEAMACGTPVVTSGRSSMPEVAGPAAVYVDPESAHGIASSVASLLADETNRRRLTKMGHERVGRFCWDRAAAATAQILRQSAGLPRVDEDEYRV
jgi:glycosyltransferase involved in cell wall biosynthesis